MASMYILTVPMLVLMLASVSFGQDNDEAAKVLAKCMAQSVTEMVDATPDKICPIYKKMTDCVLKGFPKKPTEKEVEQFQALLNSKISEKQIDCKIDVQAMVNEHYKNAGVTVFGMPWWQRTALMGVTAALVLKAF